MAPWNVSDITLIWEGLKECLDCRPSCREAWTFRKLNAKSYSLAERCVSIVTSSQLWRHHNCDVIRCVTTLQTERLLRSDMQFYEDFTQILWGWHVSCRGVQVRTAQIRGSEDVPRIANAHDILERIFAQKTRTAVSCSIFLFPGVWLYITFYVWLIMCLEAVLVIGLKWGKKYL